MGLRDEDKGEVDPGGIKPLNSQSIGSTSGCSKEREGFELATAGSRRSVSRHSASRIVPLRSTPLGVRIGLRWAVVRADACTRRKRGRKGAKGLGRRLSGRKSPTFRSGKNQRSDRKILQAWAGLFNASGRKGRKNKTYIRPPPRFALKAERGAARARRRRFTLICSVKIRPFRPETAPICS